MGCGYSLLGFSFFVYILLVSYYLGIRLMYHFDNGYHAEIERHGVEYTIKVTGNGTTVKIVHLTSSECAETLVKIRDQKALKPGRR